MRWKADDETNRLSPVSSDLDVYWPRKLRSKFAKIFPNTGQLGWLLVMLILCQSAGCDIGMPIGFTYSVFHRILDLKTGVYFYTAPFFFTITFLYDA